ncbi:prepilin-type N-terminal cleavage/methylation domain-containing protein, partial [Candidatus Parcubacteria bacterium]|nr:prepilin-type N-terminal cleavage/methylation domain-containing protein [Candidatus Parcubacteria bacterium]
MTKNEKNMEGFTLLELLIVIAILAILSAVLILILNPAETMKKSRDTQRMSDLATMKTAIGL